MPGYLAW
jgi:hypothetical protein